jgi:hypothetical protein
MTLVAACLAGLKKEGIMNVEVAQLEPGVFGVSHGSGVAGQLIRDATGSWAGHAVLYLGGNQLISGQPPQAVIQPADTYQDAIWAYRMWDQLRAVNGWTPTQVSTAQNAVVSRGHALDKALYDYPAYLAFSLEVLHLRNEQQLSGFFGHDPMRVCSGLVADAETTGKVPMIFVPEDGPGLTRDNSQKVDMVSVNLVSPGMLLGLAQRLDWA